MANLIKECVMTRACMSGATYQEEAKKLNKELNGNSSSARVANGASILSVASDNFISSTRTDNEISQSSELKQYENFFAKEAEEARIADQIGSELEALSGKSTEEIAGHFAKLFDITEEDAANIFTEDFINDIINSEDEPAVVNNNTKEHTDIPTNNHIELQNTQADTNSVVMTA